MYYYILGCGIACLVLFGIYSMETVCVLSLIHISEPTRP